MVEKCGYKQENYCKCYKKSIEQTNCVDCNNAIEIYTEKDKRELLYKAYKSAKKEKSAYNVMYMQGIYGHSAAIKDDFDSIYYAGYTIWLVIHKKYKYLSCRDRVNAFNNMQFMGMKIPKRMYREIRRLKTKCEREKF